MPEKHPTILLVDDDLQLLQLVALNLELEGYTVLLAGDGKQALSQIKQRDLDLVLLDVMMPRMDGFTVCHRVREFSTVPIILITAKERSQDKVRGLDLGADDYLTKPLNMDELLARVRAVLRRTQFREDERALSTTLALGQLTIDFGQCQVLLSNQKVVLTPTEYRLLAFLARHAGRIVPQDTLLDQVWGKEYVGEHHLLQVNINRLRHKLEADPAHPHYLLTEPGVGYMLAPQPEEPAPS
ncbi:MAG TPA: response regulator transcription factor [Ktedonobacteraceae bacterium]|nr:response regulator transcription factor [Ktedonobacteraceae bacterium]